MSAPPGAKRCRASDSGHHWASLPEDLARLIAWRVLAGGDLLDYVRFRSVCAGWRSAAVSPRGRGVTDPRFHPRRWMMLPEGHCLYPGHPDLRDHARFLNLDTGAMVRVRIPLLEDHLAVDSVDGLLLLLGDQYQQGTVRLLHPFTGDITELPPMATLLPQLLDTPWNRPVLYRIKCLASRVCASASFRAGVVTVIMLALDEVNRVAFATSLDRQWNLSSWEYPSSATRLGFQGKLYMLADTFRTARFLQIDPPSQDVVGSVGGGTLQPPKLIATIPKSKFIIASDLVECDSEILVLAFKNAKSMSRILVCKLADLVLQKRFVPIKKDIGNNTLFLGERCISVSSKVLSTLKGDNVVFKQGRQPYLAQYHMSSGKWSPAIDDCSLYGRAPGPSHLIHYIVSCCTRSLWNRGIVLRMSPPGSFAPGFFGS